jgi:hypothetical protein
MDLADAINDLLKLEMGQLSIEGLTTKPDMLDNDFKENGSDFGLEFFDHYFIDSVQDEEYSYGDLYFPTTYSNGDGGFLYLHIKFD